MSFSSRLCNKRIFYSTKTLFNRMSSTQPGNNPMAAVLATSGWDGLWQSKITPWDAGKSSPVIEELSTSVQGPVLVPGVGGGYDAITFGKAIEASNEEAIGLDISSTAIDIANQKLNSLGDSKPTNVKYIEADFFAFSKQPENINKFKTIFDYTFLCALPPTMRQDWALAMKNLLHKDGVLITLIYPAPETEYEGGPPFFMSPSLVKGLLEPVGFQQVEFFRVPDEKSHAARVGREYIAKWKHI